jgi:hypothetical protein
MRIKGSNGGITLEAPPWFLGGGSAREREREREREFGK